MLSISQGLRGNCLQRISHRLFGAGVVWVCFIIELQLVVNLHWLLLTVIRKVQLQSTASLEFSCTTSS